MSIVRKLVEPTVEILDHIARKVPQALGKGHHRMGEHVHDAADRFDRLEEELAQQARRDGHHHPASGHEPGIPAGPARAEQGGDTPGIRPHDADRSSIPGGEKHCETDPVDVATGDMLLPVTDVALPGALPLLLERTHISSYRDGLRFGPTWASTLDQRLQLDADGVVFATSDGMLLAYPAPTPEAPALPVRGPRRPLTWDGEPNSPMYVHDPATGRTLTFHRPRPAPGRPGAVVLHLVAVGDRNGRRIDIDYGDDDTPALITHHGGYRVAVDRHPTLPRIAGFRLLDTDGPGTATTLARFGYDEAGDLTEVYNSSGLPLRLRYDARHRITGWTDRTGTDYGYEYDTAGRVVRTTGSDGIMSSTFTYDDERRTTRFTDSLGHTKTYVHNAAYRLVRSVDPLGHTTLQKWDEDNRHLTEVTDPLGRVSRFTYDDSGSITAVTYPDGTGVAVSYDEQGLPTELTDGAGRSRRSEYDTRGNRLATVDPMGVRTEYAYDESGNLVSITDGLGARQHVTCDAAGLPLSVTDALGRTTTARRDAFGRIVEMTDAGGHTVRVGWTVEGQVTWCERADGRRETWEYDPEGNPVVHTDAGDRTTTRRGGRFDLRSGVADADGAQHTFAYDTERRLTKVTNSEGLDWTYTYDPLGRLVQETDFAGRTLAYGYDPAGQLVSRTNGAGQTVTYRRDVLGRLVEHSDGTRTTTYAYDDAGNMLRSANEHAETVREHDATGRVLAETTDGRRLTYAYDRVGRLTGRTTPAGVVSSWSYDPSGLPQELVVAGHRTEFSYDELGREVSRLFGTGLALSQAWDSTGRLTEQSVTASAPAGPRPVQQRGYSYRDDDYLTELSELGVGSRRFSLDATGRVTGVRARGWTESYAYDALGNLTLADTPPTRSDGPDLEYSGARLRRAGRTTYEHDAQGRVVRTARRLLSGQTRVRTFEWDAYDRLTAAVTPEGVRWTYLYDPAGRRIAKRRLTPDGGVAEEIRFTWAGTRLAEQTTSAGRTTTWEYSVGHRPVAQVDHGSATTETDRRFYAIITDLVGTPTELIAPDGQVAWQQRTTLWGIPVTDPADDSATCPLRFPGQYADPETGWHFNYLRHYDPETARYVTPDPLGLHPSPNPSAYVSHPHTSADPLGLKADWEPPDITWGGRVQYGPLDADRGNRATGVHARIQQDMLGGYTDAQVDPAGWGDESAGWDPEKKYNRGHLLGALLGGSNEDPRNFVTMHEFANSPVMRHYELQIQQAVRNGDTVHLRVTPHYRGDGDTIPVGFTLEAHSENGFKFYEYAKDPKQRRAIRAQGGTFNSVTLLNVPKCS
ncbi:DUF6531 domain-containing protein [Streptomyces sp900105755]|uniref:DUF6531 domain-containing protein n=1 Tax=Streptomyces sp. 900105755 TaxID=3154389 RepID=UPI0033276F6E